MSDLMGRVKSAWKEKRVGFEIDEVMTGEHEFEPGFGPPGRRFMEFRVTWGTQDVSRWVNPKTADFMRSPLRGTVTVAGLCEDVPVQGTLTLAYFSEQKIRYEFEFDVAGARYHFIGEKINLRPWNLHVTHTTCYGRLTEVATGKLVSKSITHFRLRSAPAFLWSLRLVA